MTVLYDRRLLNATELTVRLALPDVLSGIIQPDTLTVELNNTDGALNGINLRGERFVLDRRDLWSNEDLLELSGIVVSQTQLADRVRLEIGSHDVDDLQTLLPKRLVTAAVFPNAHPTLGIGLPIPIIFGNSVGPYPLPLVGEDLTNNYYDYLLGEASPAVVTIYRDVSSNGSTFAVVPGAEYTVNDTAYPGYRVIRFTTQQLTFSGDHYTIFAVVNGLSTERNFARAAQRVLNDATFGLGMSVNTASFDAAAAVLDAVGSLYCDGLIQTQRPAIDILNDLLMVYGMIVRKDPTNGAWIIAVEQNQTTIQAQFGHGQNQIWGNVLQDGFKGLTYTPLSQAVKTLVLEYRWHPQQSRYQLTAQRSVLSAGQERRIQNPFINDPTTGDKLVDFLSKRLLYGDQAIAFTAGQEARRLRPGQLIRYHAPASGITNVVYQARRIERTLDTVAVDAMGWDASIFTYTPGTLPSVPAIGPDTDFSRKTPTAPTALSLVASGVEWDGQESYQAKVTLQYTVANEPWAQTYVRVRRTGTTNYETVAQSSATGANLQTQITSLLTGAAYDYLVERVNTVTPTLVASASLTNQIAPGDTTPPSDPTAIAVRQSGGRVVEIDVTFSIPQDWGTVQIYRSTSNVSSSATQIDVGRKTRFHDANVTYGITYYYWAKVVDKSGNASGFSPSSGHSVTIAQVVTGDVIDNAITASGSYSNDTTVLVGTTEVEVGTLTISTTSGAGWINAKANIITASQRVTLRLRKDSLVGAGLDVADFGDVGIASAVGTVALLGYDPSPAPAQTYKLTAQVTGGSGAASVYYRRLQPVNFKK